MLLITSAVLHGASATPALTSPHPKTRTAQRLLTRWLPLLLAAVCAACGGDHARDPEPSAGSDADVPTDAASPTDDGSSESDGSALDADTARGEDALDATAEDSASSADTSLPDGGSAADAALPTDTDGGADGGSGVDPCVSSPDQALCVGPLLVRCDAQGKTIAQESCSSAAQCQLGLAPKHCPLCTPGAYRCSGAALARCTTDGASWQALETCASAALCNETMGKCSTAACESTSRGCVGDKLYGCAPDLSGAVMIEACGAGLCDDVEKACDVCAAKARSCVDDAVEVCDSQGHAATRTPCSGATPKCNAGHCVECVQPSDCPAPASSCATAICNGSSATCGVDNKAAHEACAGGVCDGAGACVGCVNSSDCKQAGKGVCLNAQCVQCQGIADCPGGYQCNVGSHSCERVSIAGTAGSCLPVGQPTNGKCGSYFCGVTPTSFNEAFAPSSVCGVNATFMCGGSLEKIAYDCWSSAMLTPIDQMQSAIAVCAKSKASLQNAGIAGGCVDCFVEQQMCCQRNANCLTDCLFGATHTCDLAMRAAGCTSGLFSCSGLPNPL